MDRRVVITGIGLVCSLGRTFEEFGDALFAGKTCIVPLEGWDIPDARFRMGGQIKDFDIKREMPDVDAKRMFRYTQFAMVSADRAIADAHLALDTANCDRIGTSFGTAAGSVGESADEAKRFAARGDRGISPAAWSEVTWSACTTHVAIHYGLRGPCSTHSAGCVTGIDTIAWSVEQIRSGKAEVMIAGGTDSPFHPFVWGLMCRSGILAPCADGSPVPRPFSKDANGVALVEGGAAVIVESEQHARLRGARIYAEICGIASVEEALPMTKLDPTGKAFAVTIQRTLHDAGLPTTAVDWVCAHGTGYAIADRSESMGIETGLGAHAFHVPVSSIRGAVGQSFASGGGFQTAAACLAIQRQRVPATLNFTEPAEGCRLDYVPNVSRVARVRRVLINTAGVGGTHSGLLLAAYEG